MTEGMELPNQEKIRTLGEKETCKYLGILEAGTIKQVEIKEYIKRTKKLLETKLNSRNHIKEINTRATPSYDTQDRCWSGTQKTLNK